MSHASRPGSTPLWRNRDFVLLQAGQLLSSTGTQSTTLVYPLLVLAATGSPADAGLVAFARLLPIALFGLFAGVAADRLQRKRLMIAADVARAIAVAGLAASILLDALALWQILLVAFVEGAGSTFFSAAAAGALRAVVPIRQLPAAAGAQQARLATVQVAGPPLGGLLFALGRAVPFVVDAASYVCSTVSLVLMRTPFQQERMTAAGGLRSQIADGFRFLWHNAFLRTCALLYGLTNVIGPALLLALVVVGQRQGLSSGEIGVLFALFGGALVVGALASPLARRALSVRIILVLEMWTWTAAALFVVWPSVYVLTAALVVSGLAIPITDSVVIGYRLAITPDHLVGRVESVRRTVSLVLAPLGPLAAGLLLESVSARVTVGVFAVFGLVLALWGTLSPAIRNAPALDQLEEVAAKESAPAHVP